MNIWNEIQNEVKLRIEAEPSLEPYLNQLILSQDNLINSVAAVLASKLNSDALSSDKIKAVSYTHLTLPTTYGV